MLKVTHISFSDAEGGAARAAYRIHQALIINKVLSTMCVNKKRTKDWRINSLSFFCRSLGLFRKYFAASLLNAMLKKDANILQSLNIFPSGLKSLIQQSSSNLIHLHWVGNEMLSIGEIGSIKQPVVWTLHDMWPFSGTEHLPMNDEWMLDYKKNGLVGDGANILNKYVLSYKKIRWKKPIHIVAPSEWMASCVRKSLIMHKWPIVVIPNPIDLEQWKPLDRSLARTLLNLPLDKKLILFGAIGGTADPNKGFNLLKPALKMVGEKVGGIELVIFGESEPKEVIDVCYPIHYMGQLSDDVSLRILYSAADLLVVPSYIEAFGQTASESQACGTPVVGFNSSGLNDIINHKKTGYLARSYEISDLINGIIWVLEYANQAELRNNCRKKIVENFSYEIVGKKYFDLYHEIVNSLHK